MQHYQLQQQQQQQYRQQQVAAVRYTSNDSTSTAQLSLGSGAAISGAGAETAAAAGRHALHPPLSNLTFIPVMSYGPAPAAPVYQIHSNGTVAAAAGGDGASGTGWDDETDWVQLVPVVTSSMTWIDVLIAVFCTLIAGGTVVGNVLVCMAVAIVRKLQTPSNLLIVSLAVSDLLVALLVMPFAAAYEVLGRWSFGPVVCNAWTSLDVLLCTASILNLCTISVDRYLVITRPLQYAVRRTPTRMALMVAGVWVTAALISIPPQLFDWRSNASVTTAASQSDPASTVPTAAASAIVSIVSESAAAAASADYIQVVEDGGSSCELSQDLGYQIYATVGAFYLPLAVMVFIYFRIYMVSARIVEAEARSHQQVTGPMAAGGAFARSRRSTSAESSASIQKPLSAVRRAGSSDGVIVGLTGSRTSTSSAATAIMTLTRRLFPCCNRCCVFGDRRGDLQMETDPKRRTQHQRDSIALRLLLHDGGGGNRSAAGDGGGLAHNRRFRFMKSSSLNRISSSRERKATKTLGVIMGAFTACWLPFFVLALAKSLACSDPGTCVPAWLSSLFLWLGYANSFLNPIIYARFNRDFRTPFRQILACRCRGINSRMRSESYADQYGTLVPGGPFAAAAAGTAGNSVGVDAYNMACGNRHGSRGSRLSVDTVVHYQSCSNRQTGSTIGVVRSRQDLAASLERSCSELDGKAKNEAV